MHDTISLMVTPASTEVDFVLTLLGNSYCFGQAQVSSISSLDEDSDRCDRSK